MKGGGGGGTLPAKKRWKGLVFGVIGLVILSMLVPLIFLLGLHNSFHSAGYDTQQQGSTSDLTKKFIKEPENKTFNQTDAEVSKERKGSLPPRKVLKPLSNPNKTRVGNTVEVAEHIKEVANSCQLKFGSYCLWRQEHREEMKDSMVKKLKDQVFMARTYYPSIVKHTSLEKLSRELKQNIQELERILSDATTDADLPSLTEKKLQKMERAVAKAKSFPVECNNIDKKLRQLVDLTEDEAYFHMKQSAFLYQLAVQTMPKSLHCLSMRLTVEYFSSPSVDLVVSHDDEFLDPELHHYIIFSNNVLASSVVVNSTVFHAKVSRSQVFHVLTDRLNFYAMKLWFFRNSYKEAIVQVLNVDDLNLTCHNKPTSHLSLPEEFRVTLQSNDNPPPTAEIRTEYLSIFSHSHYLLPEIFQNLKRVVVLDDDVVVQRDLSALWSLDMEGKVNGALKHCKVRLGQLKNYLGQSIVDGNSCAWMSGLNIIDLVKWRENNLTGTYHRLIQEKQSIGQGSSETVSLRGSLLSFQNLIYALDGAWAMSGLGHDYGLDTEAIKSAAVLHYNGHMKPWLELGIPKYRNYWKKFLNQEDQSLSQCNINP